MNANRTLNRLFLICSLALPAAFALGQAPDSFSGWTVLLDGSDPGVSEKLEFTGASTFKSTFSDGGQSFTSTETYTFTKTGANTAEIATPNTDGSEDKYLFQFTSAEGGTGELKDYVIGNYAGQNSYQHVSGNLYLDLSGSWNFTFEKLPAWEDYDDFNDNSLDAANWETGYWPGAQAPTEANGRIELSGTGINSGTKHPNFFNELFAAGLPSNGTHHSILALQESEFIGIEAELTLPATNTFGSGVYLSIIEKISATSIGGVNIELGYWGSTPSLSFENGVYENGNEVVDEDLDKAAAAGQGYCVAILKSGDLYKLYLEDELIKEYPVRGTTAYFHLAAFHDQGQPFTAYVDNVRVLRDSSIDLARGLVAHYPFDGNASDMSVNGNHATIYGGASLGADRHGVTGKAYGFDGAGDYISTNLSNSLSGKELTISAWVNMLSPGSSSSFSYPYIIHAKGAENEETFSMGIESDWVEVWGAGRGLYFSESRRLTSGQWAMLTASLNEDALTYYVNGQLNEATSAGAAKSLDLSSISIGAREGNNFWNGSIDDIRIYDRALTAAEVAALYELEKPASATVPDPATVVSTPDGKPVVVKVGDVYNWNSTLDGVTLWGVWEDEDNGWTAATIQYVDGKQKGNIGLNDQLTSDLIVDHPYVVDESGMIKVTEDTAYQYYQVTGVENGVIQTADDSVFPLSDTSWFFTTRAAAEEYYYSKAGYPKPKGWMWFDQYPWVYSDEEKGWLYFKPSGDKLHYWSYKYKTWQEYAPK